MPAQPPTQPPIVVSDKPAKKFDPFHPEMPQIPGVPGVNDARRGASRRDVRRDVRRIVQIGGIVAATLLIGISVIWWMRSAPRPADVSSSAAATNPDQPVPEPAPSPASSLREGPVVAATVEELSKPWAAKKFNFVRPLTQESVEAIVIRLPGGGLWAFALQEPYGRCKLEFITDPAQLAKQYDYRASHPMVANPCNGTIYDPLKVGPMGGDEWIRGEIVRGGGLRPPLSINVQESGHSIIADRME